MALYNGLDRGKNLSDLDSAAAAVVNLGLTATAAEINALDETLSGLSAAELQFLNGATAGTQVASKAVVADTNINTGVVKATELHVGATGSETQVSATPAELNLLDGSGPTNPTASIVPVLDANKRLVSTATTGAAGTGVTAVEFSADGLNFTTILTVTAVALTIGDDGSLGVGTAALYTFPAGAIGVRSATMSLAISADDATNQSDTPDVGIGTTIASGGVVVLGGTGAFENIITGSAAGDCDGTATLMTSVATLAIEAAGTKVVLFNAACSWGNGSAQTATVGGTLVLNWSHLPLA